MTTTPKDDGIVGRGNRDSARRTSSRQAAALSSRSFMYRCSTVPPVYLRCSSSWRVSASNGSSVKPTGSCELLV